MILAFYVGCGTSAIHRFHTTVRVEVREFESHLKQIFFHSIIFLNAEGDKH